MLTHLPPDSQKNYFEWGRRSSVQEINKLLTTHEII